MNKSFSQISHIRIPFLILLLITECTIRVFALDPGKTISQYGRNVWSKQNGLPSTAVNVVLQTHDGYLWIGTTAGLYRFDGERFDWINTDPRDNENRVTITALCESSDSSLWIGTANSWVYRLKNGKMFHHGEQEGLLSRNINTIFESRDGKIWIGASYGLYKYIEGKIISIPIEPNYITGITEDSRGRLWVGTYAGVRIFDDKQKVRTLKIAGGLRRQLITSLFADHHGTMWIGTYDGLIRWRNDTLKIYSAANGLSDSHITSICEDRDDNLWIGTDTGGINRFTNGNWTAPVSSDDLSNHNIPSMTEDHEGSLWICTSDGLNQLRDVSLTTYTTKEGLANDYISSIIETPDGSICFLSDKGSNITCLKNGNMTISSNLIGPVYVARDGSMWISQTGLLMNFKDGKRRRYDTRTGLPNKWISAIGEDSVGLVVFVDNTGLRRFINGRLVPFILSNGQVYSSIEHIGCFYLEPGGTFWMGTSRGLVRIQNGKSTVFGYSDGMADHYVSSIFDDHQGSLWISSPHGGLTRYKQGKFSAYTTKAGLFTNEIYCVLCDDGGDIWLSSPRGIGHIRRKDFDDYDSGRIKLLQTQVYTTADGMKTDECFGEWQPAGWKAHDGCLWFPTRKGAVKIDPKAFQRNEIPPPVLIEKVVVDEETVSGNEQHITLSPGKDKLEFHYTALSFLVPERVLFKYILEGYDHDWVDAGARRVAYYTNLSPGEYRFRVIACNNDGVWNERGAIVAFTLERRFYQSFWFYGIMLAALGGAGFGIYRIRVWQLLKREKELNARIEEATAKIKTLNGLIPICASCKKIRDDKGYWDQLEHYIHEHSEATFSHGVCPECAEKLYGKYYAQMKKQHKDAAPQVQPPELPKE